MRRAYLFVVVGTRSLSSGAHSLAPLALPTYGLPDFSSKPGRGTKFISMLT